MIIRIRDILDNGQFGVFGNVRIFGHRWTEERGNETVEKWGGDIGGLPGCTRPSADLMEHEITGMYVTEIGCLEIEYDLDEFMGYETEEESHDKEHA